MTSLHARSHEVCSVVERQGWLVFGRVNADGAFAASLESCANSLFFSCSGCCCYWSTAHIIRLHMLYRLELLSCAGIFAKLCSVHKKSIMQVFCIMVIPASLCSAIRLCASLLEQPFIGYSIAVALLKVRLLNLDGV